MQNLKLPGQNELPQQPGKLMSNHIVKLIAPDLRYPKDADRPELHRKAEGLKGRLSALSHITARPNNKSTLVGRARSLRPSHAPRPRLGTELHGILPGSAVGLHLSETSLRVHGFCGKVGVFSY